MRIKQVITLILWTILCLFAAVRAMAGPYIPNVPQTYNCTERRVVNRFDLPDEVWTIIPYDAPIVQFACGYTPTLEALEVIPAEHCTIDEILGPQESEDGFTFSINWYCAYQSSLPIVINSGGF